MLNALALALLSATPEFHYQFSAGQTPQIEVSIVSGSVSVKPSRTGSVKIDARTTGNWIVEAKEHQGEIEVRACCGRCDSDREKERCEGSAFVELEVPEGSELEVNTVSAPVRCEGVRGRHEVSTVSGKVALAPGAAEEIEVSSVSGDVKLDLPRDANATVSLTTVSGRLNGGRAGLGTTERKYGAGEHEIEVSTVSGSVDVAAR
jgi:DUF4097 and DUF4098 domain-containing protein YvlB